MSQTEKVLSDYSQSVGTNAIKYNDEVSGIISLKIEDIRLLDETECGIYAYSLSQYATFIQKEVNRHSAKLKWATHNLDIIVGKLFNNYGDKYTKYEVKRVLVCNENEYARALNKIILEATIRIEELAFLSARVSEQSKILIELQKTKRAEKYENRGRD